MGDILITMTKDEPSYQYRWMQQRQAKAPLTVCACGCGTSIPSITLNGAPRRFVKGHHNKMTPQPRGPDSPSWKGGESRLPNGYVRVTITPEEGGMFPSAYCHGGTHWNIPRSHLVWNRAHPQDLVQKSEHVHHVNRVRDDDRIENLKKMNGREHVRLHGLKAI